LTLFASILADAAIFSVAALGIMVIFAWAKLADLTPDASFAAGSVGVWLAIDNLSLGGIGLLVAGAICGGAMGAVTYVITLFRVPQLLASLITVGLGYSVNWQLLGKPLRSIPSPNSIFSGVDLGLDALIAVAIAAACALLVGTLAGTLFGISLRASSENSNSMPNGKSWATFSRLVLLVGGNCLVGLSGAMFASKAYFAEINIGNGALISGLSAFLLGWAIFRFNAAPIFAVGGAVLGAILLRVVMTGALSIGAPAEIFRAITSLVLLLCLIVARGGDNNPLKGVRL